MAIAITEGCMDQNPKVIEVCGKDVDSPIAVRGDSAGNGGSSTPVPDFHRHCQKTVCSAYGYNGQGKTWETLYKGSDDLPHLNLGLQEGERWYNKFQANDENITQDLRSILELINATAGSIATSWTLIFNDNNGNQITTKDITPWASTTKQFEIGGFGRDIQLTIDDRSFVFNTMKNTGREIGTINLEKFDLNVTFNDQSVGTVPNIYMPSEQTLNIKQDFNKLPTINYNLNNPPTIDGSVKVYRIYTRGTGSMVTSLTPQFTLSSNYEKGQIKMDTPVLEWELHVRNNNGTGGDVTIEDPVITYAGESTSIEVEALTDQLYVQSAKTNVYVFRADMFQPKVTYSLAYVY